MLVYGKRENDAWELYGTRANVPGVNDQKLTYKDVDGDTLSLVTGDKYFDDGKGGIVRQSDEKFMGVFINGETKAIIPNGWEPEAKEVKKVVIKTAPDKVTYDSGEALDLSGLELTVTYKDGDKATVTTGYTSVPANGATLAAGTTKVTITYGGKSCEQAITVNEAMSANPNVWRPSVSATSQEQICTISNHHGSLTTPAPEGSAPVSVSVTGNDTIKITLDASALADQTSTVTVKDSDNRTCTVAVQVVGA